MRRMIVQMPHWSCSKLYCLSRCHLHTLKSLVAVNLLDGAISMPTFRGRLFAAAQM